MTKKALTDILPIKFRHGAGVGKSEKNKEGKTVYDKYLIVPYIDARDVMDHLDEVEGPMNRAKKYESINGKMYCGVGIKRNEERVRKRDVGDKTAISADKGEASDAFKRASVCRGVGRFLYSMPKIILTKEELSQNRYTLASFVREKYKEQFLERVGKYEAKIEDMKLSKYDDEEEHAETPAPKSMEEMVNMDDREEV